DRLLDHERDDDLAERGDEGEPERDPDALDELGRELDAAAQGREDPEAAVVADRGAHKATSASSSRSWAARRALRSVSRSYAVASSAYPGSRASSSACVPRSTTRPPSRCTTSSASRIELMR